MSMAPAQTPAQPTDHRVDPGSRRAARFAWIALFVLAGVVFGLQQVGVSGKTAAAQATAPESEPLVGPFDAPLMMGKLMVKLGQLLPPDQRPELARSSGLDPKSLPLADAIASIPIIAEMAGTEAAADAIASIQTKLTERAKSKPDEAGVFAKDLLVLEALYAQPTQAFDPASLTPEQLQRLSTRFGWAGELAQARGLPDSDPRRAKLIDGGWQIIVLVTLFLSVIALGLFVGLPLLIIGLVMLGTGRIKPRLERMNPGGSVGIEVAAVFVACFLVLKLIAGVIGAIMTSGKAGPELAAAEGNVQLISFGLQWLILPVVLLWPRIRGFDGPASRHALGLHAGKGVFREIGAGVVGYVASLPLLFAGAVVTLIAMTLWQAIQSARGVEPPSGPINPLLEYFSSGPLLVAMLGALAVVWAPIVEEIVFRGGLLRQLRGPLNIILAGALTAVVFAAMHGYSPLMMAPLVSLALGFSLMRYWRGSLIACITAHALHNALVSCVLAFMVSVVG